MTDYYNTLVLSGGSVKAISMLGAIQYCYDNDLIKGVKHFIGTSAGGIIAYFLAIGYTPTELMVYMCTNDIFKDAQYFNLVSMMNGEGAISFSNIQEHLEKMTIDKIGRLVTFAEIKKIFNKHLVVTTYNYKQQKKEYLSYETTPDMPCIVALRMTASLPFIFKPFKYMDNYYIDGGIYDNFPITYNMDEDKNSVKSHRLGITVDFYSDTIETENPCKDSILEYIYKILTIMQRQNLDDKLERAKNIDIIKIQTDVTTFNFGLNSQEKMDLFSGGYSTATHYFNPIED